MLPSSPNKLLIEFRQDFTVYKVLEEISIYFILHMALGGNNWPRTPTVGQVVATPAVT